MNINKIPNIYFTSDTHYNHKNIVRGTTGWDIEDKNGSHLSLRDFDTLEEHNEVLVSNINSLVKENDELWHLGDVAFGGHENIKVFLDKLNCKNVNLVLGNHDQHIKPINSPYRELFKSVQERATFSLKLGTEKTNKYGKQMFFLSHYSHRIWENSHHGSIHLYGHSHGSLPGIGKSMDVGVDTNKLYPYHLEEILFYMKDIKVHIIDHHNDKTS
jgi:calcineurin-like phosphoesterase family protein